MANAASFPLGSIMPWSKSFRFRISPCLRFAVVPPKIVAYLEIFTDEF